MEPLRAILRVQLIRMALIHAVLWLIGIAAIAFGTFQFSKSEQRRSHAEEALKKANEELEKQVQIRTAELVKINKALQHYITDRKQAEETLRESERKYRELVQNANSIILRWRRDGNVTFMNEFGQKFFGYSESEILGKHVVGTIVPETESTGRDLRPLMDQICADPAAFENNVNENMRKDGSRVWIAWTNKVVLDEQGQVKEILSIGSDITERKRAEEALRQSEEKFRQFAENICEVFWMTDPKKNQMIYISPAYESIWGRSCTSLYTSAQDWADAIHPEDRQRVWEAATAKQAAGEYDEIYRIKRSDGTVRWIHDRAFPVKDQTGQIYRIAGIAEDITERKRTDEEIHKLNAELEQRVRDRTRELIEKNAELERMNRLFVGRELRMVELKERIKELEKKQ